MHTLIALYHPPREPAQFRHHLVKVHLPIVQRFPGLRALRYTVEPRSPEGPSPYAAIVECDFDSESAMHAALSSEAGLAAAADVPNYAAAGVTIVTFPVSTLETRALSAVP